MTDTIFTSQTPDTLQNDTDVRNLGQRFQVSAAGHQIAGGRVWVPPDGLATVDLWQVWDEPATTLLAEYDLHDLGAVTPNGWNDIPVLPSTTIPVTAAHDYIVTHYRNGAGSNYQFAFTSPGAYPVGSGGVVSSSIGVFRNFGLPTDMPTGTFNSYHFVDVNVDPIVVPVPVGMACECDSALPVGVAELTPVGMACECDSALPIGVVELVPVGMACECDSALPVPPKQPNVPVPVGMACECDKAFPVPPSGGPGTPKLATLTWAVAKLLRDCLCLKLLETLAGPVCRCSLMAGDSAIADICEDVPGMGNGQAWVRMTRLFISRDFPRPAIDTFNCAGGIWAAEFELGVLRCAVGPDDEGQPPSAEELNNETAMVFDDAYALRIAAECCLPSGIPSIPAEWTPMSSGGCTGGRITVQVWLVPGPHELSPAMPMVIMP